MFDDFVIDAVSDGNTAFDYGTPRNAQRLLTRFNWQINSIIERHGLDATGTALWYLYGSVSGMTYDVLDDSVEDGYGEFYKSMRSLYDIGFAGHCENRGGHSDVQGGKFATACYMLWDMDSGLEHLTFHGSSLRLALVDELITFGLRHDHAAVQESFLHCLGHRLDEMPNVVKPKLSEFLKRNNLSPEIREYARQCQTGKIL